MITVLLGGARSGKSRLAVDLGRRASDAGGQVVFVATAPAIEGDDELASRIEAHRHERPDSWTTVEEETDLAGALRLAADDATIVVDCLTLWIGNLQHRGDDQDAITASCRTAIAAAVERSGDTVVVSNEVGLGIVPADATSRAYRDVLGIVNRAWVEVADRAILLVAGRALPLHDLGELLA